MFGEDEILLHLKLGVLVDDQLDGIACKLKNLAVAAQVGNLQVKRNEAD